MKHILLLFFVSIFLLSGCKKPNNNDATPHTIVLFSPNSSNHTGITIKADNKEEVNLKCSVKDINGVEINTSCMITLNGEKYTEGSFKTVIPGSYVFQASIGEIVSNTYTVTAMGDQAGSAHKIELSADRAEIMANDVQEVLFNCKVTDKNGLELPVNCSFTVNNIPSDNTFKTSNPGEYSVQASFGGLVSNKITIKANSGVDGKAFKIILDSDRYLGTIKANNKDEAVFKVRVTDLAGRVLNEPYQLTVNGNPFSGTSFKTNQAGEYVFQAAIGSLTSNRYAVTATEIADTYITIQSSTIETISTGNKVTVGITYKNTSAKALKYATFDVSCFDKNGVIIQESVKGSTVVGVQATGFFDPGRVDTSRFEIGTFPGTDHIKVTLRSVTLDDGTIITAG